MSVHNNAAQDASGGTAPQGRDGRNSPRKRMLKAGRVIVDHQLTIDCIIRDMGEGGARLVFGAPMALDGDLELLVVATQTVFPALLVWHRGLAAGVRFVGPGRPTADGGHRLPVRFPDPFLRRMPMTIGSSTESRQSPWPDPSA